MAHNLSNKLTDISGLSIPKGTWIINFTQDPRPNVIDVAITRFSHYHLPNPNTHFRPLNDRAIELKKSISFQGLLIPHITLSKREILPTTTKGYFKIIQPNDYDAFRNSLESEGFGQEAYLLTQYNPQLISPV